jgi:peptidyl-prolyl cis-trans isomerase A (cyclophilin A)
MIAYSRCLFLAAAALVLAGCSNQPEKAVKAPEKLEHAPDAYRVKLETSKGDIVLQIHKDWAPIGADRFYQLVQSGFFDGARFFRMISGFMVQFGIAGDPKVQSLWRMSPLMDDPVKQTNSKGRITFATSGPQSRTTQVFINLADNARLDASGFAPFGEVVSGMDVAQSLYAGYGEGYPGGNGPRQDLIQTQGNAYLEKDFPRLDFVKKATIQ